MPYTTPNSFTAGNNIQADELTGNNEALRLYINSAIEGGDIQNESISTQEILRGEYLGVVKEHQFVSGEIIGARKDTQPFNRSYFTGQMKQVGDYTTVAHYMPIPNTGKRIYLEREATIHIHGYYQFVVGENSLNSNTVGTDHIIYQVIDSAVPSSYALCFSQESTASPNSGAVIGSTLNNRRSYPITYIDTLSAGSHDIYLSINCDTDKGYVSAINLVIEIFYV